MGFGGKREKSGKKLKNTSQLKEKNLNPGGVRRSETSD